MYVCVDVSDRLGRSIMVCSHDIVIMMILRGSKDRGSACCCPKEYCVLAFTIGFYNERRQWQRKRLLEGLLVCCLTC